MASYRPIGSLGPRLGMLPNTRAGDDEGRERDRGRPEGGGGGGGGDTETPPGEGGPPPEGGGGDGGGGEDGGVGGPSRPTMPPVGAGNPFLQPGTPMAGRPYRTPAFFTNRYVGGFAPQPARVGPGTSMAAQQRPPLDEELLRSLVARFSGGGGMIQ